MASSGTINWPGASGESYTYHISKRGASFKAAPGNYIFAKETSPGRWTPIYIGQTENLHDRLDGHNEEPCADRNGATHIHTHLNTAGKQARLAEETDLIQRWEPPCNQ